MAENRNLVPMAGLAIVVGFLIYGSVVAESGASGSPVEIFGPLGAALLYTAILATFATIFVAARRAHRAGSWLWFFAVILVWPLSYVYALGVNRNG
jgi:hypothetical protein